MDLQRFVDLAAKLLAKFGTEFAISRYIPPGRDDAGHETPGSWQDLTPKVLGVVQQFNPFEVDGSRILSGDVRFVCDNRQVLAVGDRVVIGGQLWRVEAPGPIRPHGGVIVCHRAQLRRV